MDPKTGGDIIAGPQSIDLDTDAGADAQMTEETAARLRAICDATSEPFDASLTEAQAQKRIAALRELHDLD
ncbi:DUF3072 domain-containing protein [Roseobacter sinensis]|uniref:DUF3072 domain-containing protein n=1 Tax=Roseobacter sinensis TaxID=2931391 RepID=A0ABT3BAW2_9RHOB|nr:DUF3072 domain-containing protein [Roseobacter sp. WL0113]MCV3270549.1 DUF3072 domain-containing protein [Roseobacter sp. WL0113]